MDGSLGEKLGEGVMADIHAWAPGQVVKLLKPGIRRRSGVHEARMTRAVFAAGGPAPEVLGEVMLDGRFGMVLRRLEGPTLFALTRSGGVSFEEAGAILAGVLMAVHQTPPPPEVFALRVWMEACLQQSDGVPQPLAAGVLALIDRLPPGDELIHGDLHTGNVIMAAEGPVIIDWTAAMRAPAALDVANSLFMLTELGPELADNPERPRAVGAAAQAEYARLTGMTAEALAAAVEPFLPVARVLALLGRGINGAQRERLLLSLEATLRAEG